MTRGVRWSARHAERTSASATVRAIADFGLRIADRKPPGPGRNPQAAIGNLLWNIRLLQSQKIREEAVAADHAAGQLPEKGEPGVDVFALAEGGDEQAAGERRAAGVVGLEDGLVGRIPIVGEVEPALLNPPLPVGGRDLIGRVEHGAGRVEL